ncbi:uncharacterized protein MEPE_06601 [Melanopsichium pennsylvanicum]|uniref:Arrestin-like N-terminal domain-containing protein n=2 Tax=Melanopsichium pennsylvanicum TaxID=63383 RepID=A0AAJ4XS52_9BASI|nr:hypothetical protein BN887_02302 [Melanopsichium pennsylvanicum 4]SNX87890.1 uncharacterized protein MEPE_06601 [Melanopsichium pennsylvanicum]
MGRIARPPMPVKAVPLKTVHTYLSNTGNASLNIYSYPQRVPTFMGGSYERGWGALAGHVDIHVTEASGDRISAIKLTLTATQFTTVPKTASIAAPSALDRLAIDPEETKTTEVTLLHMEHILFQPIKTDSDRDANLLSQGNHVYPFSIELPLAGNKDKKNPPLLPPSCVIEPLITCPNTAQTRQNSSGLFGRSKSGKDNARPAWATVKYRLKLTVQKPGILKRNLRSYAPFVYLPSPPASATALLLQRRAMGAQMAAIVLQRQGDGCQPIETPVEWRARPLSFLVSPNGPQKLELEKKSGFLSNLFGGPKKQAVVNWHEAWTFSMPLSGRSSFPLRSAIPFIARCTTNKPIDLSVGSPLAFRLYRRVRLLSGRKQKAVAMQQQPVAEAALRYAVESSGVFRLNGIISLPPNCVPNFDLPSLSLDYYIGVVRILDGVVVHKEFVNLACPPPVEPKAAYGAFPSGVAWRSTREAALQLPDLPSSFDKSLPLAPRSIASSSSFTPAPSTRQRPSFSSIATSSSSSAHAASGRPSFARSTRSHRSDSTDSAYASVANSLSHANTGSATASVPMGLAGMANPPPASSAGYAQMSGNLDPVREQGRGVVAARTRPPPTSPPRETSSSSRRAPNNDSDFATNKDTSDTVSVASSRRRTRYSSKGAVAVSEADSTRSSVELDYRQQDTGRYVHSHEKAPLPPDAESVVLKSGDLEAGSSTGAGRRGLSVANAKNLPSIPSKTSALAREQANALVGASSSSTHSANRSREKGGRGSSSNSPSSRTEMPASQSRKSRGTAAANAGGTAGQARRIMVAPAAAQQASPPPSAAASQRLCEPAYVAPPPASSILAPVSQQPPTQVVDPSALLTNEDLLYGEDMELDLPPSYFEAVYGGEDDEDEG